ncbi:MAG: exported protein of unknown function [Schlesneria sp.]|nr:exported protein of unknown function [Schlesneria sp.]
MASRASIGLFSILFGAGAFAFWNVYGDGAQAEEKAVASAKKPLIEFTSDGKAKKPVGYRKWIYIGTPVTPNDMNGGEASFPEFHNVYIDPESFDHLEKTGEYRDGTVLVKELTSVGTKKASSGNGYFEGEFTGLEMSVKDSKRFAGDPGSWGYFSFGHKYPLKEAVAKNDVASCNSCHETNAKNFVFSAHYPVLRAAFSTDKK